MIKLISNILTASLFILLSVQVQASAGQHDDHQLHNQLHGQQQSVSQQSEISQRKAIAIAQKHIKGRVLDIKPENGVYRVKILSDRGMIHVVRVNAANGKIISGH